MRGLLGEAGHAVVIFLCVVKGLLYNYRIYDHRDLQNKQIFNIACYLLNWCPCTRGPRGVLHSRNIFCLHFPATRSHEPVPPAQLCASYGQRIYSPFSSHAGHDRNEACTS